MKRGPSAKTASNIAFPVIIPKAQIYKWHGKPQAKHRAAKEAK
jgi:hypothetical protein